MDRILFTLGDTPVTLELALYAALGLFAALLVALLVVVSRQSRRRSEEAAFAEARARETERHLADLMRVQSEMTGRMQTMSEIFGSRTSDLARLVNERLDSQGQRIGAAMTESNTKTTPKTSGRAARVSNWSIGSYLRFLRERRFCAIACGLGLK